MTWIVVGIIIVIGVISAISGNSKNAITSRSVGTQTDDKEMVIPNDAHDAVERFAAIASQTQNVLKQNGWLHSDSLARASVHFSFGKDDLHSKVSMWFDFDTSMEGFHERFFGYQLGEGFTVNDDKVQYESDQVENLQKWLNIKPDSLAGGGNAAVVDPIAVTFLNSCPGAHAELKSIDNTGCLVVFKFR